MQHDEQTVRKQPHVCFSIHSAEQTSTVKQLRQFPFGPLKELFALQTQSQRSILTVYITSGDDEWVPIRIGEFIDS